MIRRQLQVRSTQRNAANLPSSLESLPELDEVDLGQNALSRLPDGLFTVTSLRKLNVSDNLLGELHSAVDLWCPISFFSLSLRRPSVSWN